MAEKNPLATATVDPHEQNNDALPRQHLADVESEIALADQLEHTDPESEKAVLQASLQRLMQKRASLNWEINKSAPILRLSPEITYDIFVTCLAGNVWEYHIWEMSPLTLGKICKAWREIAWAAPKLWNKIKLDLDQRVHPRIVKEWFDRSNQLPLSIYISVCLDSPISNGTEILDLVAQYSERWERVAFELPDSYYRALAHVKHRLPILRSITLDQETLGWDESDPLDIFSLAPQLRDVRMQGFLIDAFVLPVNQLTKLSIRTEYLEDCMHILRLCPQTTDVGFYNTSMCENPIEPYHSEHLKTLDLNVWYDLSDLLDSLTVPAARELSCRGIYVRTEMGEFPCDSLSSFTSRSACSLHKLCLTSFVVSEPEFMECLRAMPSLVELTLRDLTITMTTFRALIPGEGQVELPNLKVFHYAGDLELEFPVVATLLRARSSNNEFNATPLQVVSIETHRLEEPPAEVVDQMRELVGMKITLITHEQHWL